MRAYAARRLLLAVPTLFGLSLLVFLLGMAAGDPAEELARGGLLPGEEPTPEQVAAVRHELGLDRPFAARYGHWLGQALHGDLGRSLYAPLGVTDQIRGAASKTAALALAGLVLIVIVAIPLGVAGALYHGRWPDHLLRLVALGTASVPGFFLAYLLMYVFSVRLRGFLPPAGAEGLRSLVLPAIVVAAGPAAIVSRLLRSSLLEVLGEPYIAMARSKGASGVAVMFHHALRNAAIPALTVLGGVAGRLLEGAVIVEFVFARPGLGLLTFNAIGTSDYPVVQGTILLAGTVFILLNLLVDLSYAWIDPRVRLGAAA